jgi:hypothetical protein
MAYPMTTWPTFGELKQRLAKEFGCTFKELSAATLTMNGGLPGPITYFEREVEGEKLRYSMITYADDERIAPFVIRPLCRRLKIDPKAFGLTLG